MQEHIPDEFLDWMARDIENFAAEVRLAPSAVPEIRRRRAFPGWTLQFLHEIDPQDAQEYCDTLRDGDAGLDGWYLDVDSDVFYLFQAKYPDQPSELVGLEELHYLSNAYLLLLDPVAAEQRSTALLEPSRQLVAAIDSSSRVILRYVVAGRVSEVTLSSLETTARALPHSPDVDLIDIDSWYALYVARETSDDLEGQWVAMPYATLALVSDDIQDVPGITGAAIATFDAVDFANAVAPFGSKIIDANIRYHLGATNRINQGVRSTLREQFSRSRFWFYNNGITIVVNDWEMNGDSIRLLNPQVVNGGQTTRALTDLRHHLDRGDASLLARLIKTSRDSDGRERVLEIAEFTNSQSPVTAADLKANDRIQRELEAELGALDPAWFYERKRGAWNNLTLEVRRMMFRDDDQSLYRRVSATDIGQRWWAYSGSPSEAALHKDQIWLAPTYGSVFRIDRSSYMYLFVYWLHRDLWALLSNPTAEEVESLGASWLTETTLNRLARAKKTVVFQLLALAGRLLERTYGTRDLSFDQARVLFAQLYEEPTSLAWGRSLLIAVLHEWYERLQEDDDLKREIQRSDTVVKLSDLLDEKLALTGTDPVAQMPQL